MKFRRCLRPSSVMALCGLKTALLLFHVPAHPPEEDFPPHVEFPIEIGGPPSAKLTSHTANLTASIM